MTQTERRIELINRLLAEDPQYQDIRIPEGETEQKSLLRGLLNVRRPQENDPDFLTLQDTYLEEAQKDRGIVDPDTLTFNKEGLAVWQGDITTLAADAIVNAANSGMTGCYAPNHTCIDNCIHTFAGVQLRKACADIMQKQGYEEPTGQAKITPGFNLPCTYVLHTVGPIVYTEVSDLEREQLASCYTSCLDLASQNGCKSIAFCCISTGVFRFPNAEASKIAVETVRDYLKKNDTSVEHVIFNVFKDVDLKLYQDLLEVR